MSDSDRWSRWLLERRDAGLDAQRTAAAVHLAGIRDRVLDRAGSLDGATVLDVGTGDGLIGLAALERVGPAGQVIFSDVSEPLLARCRAQVDELGLSERARFVRCGAEDLVGVKDGSIDLVTTRSVLIYVADKPTAFAAFRRVLTPTGRLSLFEPINQLMHPEPPGRFFGYDLSAVPELVTRVSSAFAGDPAAHVAMSGFDDRDLLQFADDARFSEIRLDTTISVTPGSTLDPVSFDALLGGAPNPNAPTVREAIESTLPDSERSRFLAELRAAYDDGRCRRCLAGAYLSAAVAAPAARPAADRR